MNENEEKAYLRGSAAVYRELLTVALRGLHREDAPDTIEGLRLRVAQLETVHAETISALRQACDDHGDNDWEDDLHPADIINKHLVCYIETDDDEEGL